MKQLDEVYRSYSTEDLISLFRYWYKHRHGMNSGLIRGFAKNYLKFLKERRVK